MVFFQPLLKYGASYRVILVIVIFHLEINFFHVQLGV